jgi:hypothetical protein
MNTFDVLLKEGKKFQLQFDKFDYNSNGFVLYDESHKPSEEGFLLFDAIAAIVPTSQPRSDKIEAFRIQLKNDQHVDIYAHSFDLKQKPSVKFYVRVTDESEPHEVINVYVATSEVIAITPAEGLRYERRRSLQDW